MAEVPYHGLKMATRLGYMAVVPYPGHKMDAGPGNMVEVPYPETTRPKKALPHTMNQESSQNIIKKSCFEAVFEGMFKSNFLDNQKCTKAPNFGARLRGFGPGWR